MKGCSVIEHGEQCEVKHFGRGFCEKHYRRWYGHGSPLLREEGGLTIAHGHGRRGHATRTYKTWKAMRRRTTNPKDTKYANYGGKGIKVCERWSKFENFLADMGERPDGFTISRLDHDGDYCPENCAWAPAYSHMGDQHG